jgi:hypothetical protein
MRHLALVVLVLATGCLGRGLSGPPYAAHYTQVMPCDDKYPDATSALVSAVLCGATYVPVESAAIDVAADPLRAAALASAVAATPEDEGYGANHTPTRLAWAWDLAARVDEDTVAALLEKSSLPGYKRRDFLARYGAVRARLREQVSARGEHWYAVFLAPMLEARAARAAADAALAEWPARATERATTADRAVLAGTADAELLADVLGLRRSYVAACVPVRGALERCLGDGTGKELSRVIERVAVAVKDQPLLAAEGNVLRLADFSDPRADEWIAVRRAFEAERARFAAYAKARGAGVAADALAERWPEPPMDLAPQDFVLGVEPPPGSGGYHGRGDVEIVQEEVRVIVRAKDRATIQWRKNVYRGLEATGCRETNKVDGVDEHGRLIYRTVCTGPDRAYTDDRTVKPVEVPWVEVAAVEKGEIVEVAVDRKTRVGHVIQVMGPRKDASAPPSPVVQLREWRRR